MPRIEEVASNDVVDIFGGKKPWDASLWTATDDRVRGGSSISHLTIENPTKASASIARFSGNLDTSTLGGAGFASQRTKGELDLDLKGAAGLLVKVRKTDGKRYLVTLKDDIPGRRDDGREMSGITWEAEIASAAEHSEVPSSTGGDAEDVFLPWSAFEATYRGRPKDDAKPLKLESIKRVSFMMRSFFDQQKGDFSLDIESIAAVYKCDSSSTLAPVGTDSVADADADEDECDLAKAQAGVARQQQERSQRWWRRMLCGLV